MSEQKIMSGIGGLFYECGFIAIIILLCDSSDHLEILPKGYASALYSRIFVYYVVFHSIFLSDCRVLSGSLSV